MSLHRQQILLDRRVPNDGIGVLDRRHQLTPWPWHKTVRLFQCRFFGKFGGV